MPRSLPRTAARLAPVAVLAFAATVAACFDDKAPTQQIGGTQYGMQLTVPSPLRLPSMTLVTGRTGRTTVSSVTATLSNLELLGGSATYTFYAVTPQGVATPVAARLTRLRTDTIINDANVTVAGNITPRVDSAEIGTSTSFKGTGNNAIVRARFNAADFADTTRAFLVLTIQPNEAAPDWSDATPKPLFAPLRRLIQTTADTGYSAVLTAATATFGTFRPSRTTGTYTPDSYVFSATGRGRSAFWDRERDGRLLFQAIAENLSQPPLGYFYQPWIRDTSTARAVRFGELRDFAGVSLRDADLTPRSGLVAQLPSARFGTSEDTIGAPLNSFRRVDLILEPKLGTDTVFALGAVLVGTIGDTLGLRGRGSLDITVRRGGQPLGNAVVFVTAAGTSYLLGSGPTDDAGKRTFTGISALSAGPVEIRVRPPGQTSTLTAPTSATVVRREMTSVTIDVP